MICILQHTSGCILDTNSVCKWANSRRNGHVGL